MQDKAVPKDIYFPPPGHDLYYGCLLSATGT